MSLIKDSHRLCQECKQSEATKAIIIHQKLKWYVCDDCAKSYSGAMLTLGMKMKLSDGVDGRIAEFK